MFRTASLVLCFVTAAWAYPSGPLPSVCGSMMPQHYVPAQTSDVPYAVSISKNSNTYTANEQITVTLQKNTSLPFKGYMVQPRKADDATVGIITIPSGAKNPCTAGTVAISHSEGSLKDSIQFVWTAPSTNEGDIRFVYTVVQSGSVLWDNKAFGPLTPEGFSTQPPTTQPPTTQPPTTQPQSQPPTTQPTRNGRPTVIDRDPACRVTKGCFPDSCQTDCDYLVTWEDVSTEEFEFTLRRKTSSPDYYIAVGLSHDQIMMNDSVSQCVSRNGVVIVQSSFNRNAIPSGNQVLDNSVYGVTLVDDFYENGILGCTYRRKKNAGYVSSGGGDESNFFDLEEDWYLFVANGSAIQGTMLPHSTRPDISPQKIDFQDVTGTTVEPSSPVTQVTGSINKNGCGSEWGCFCGSNNDFCLRWSDDGEDFITFRIDCKQSGNRYCAFGFSTDRNMGGDYVIGVGPDGQGGTEVSNFYNDGKSCAPLTYTQNGMTMNNLGLRVTSQSYVNGILSVLFQRDKTFTGAVGTSRKKRAAADASKYFDMDENRVLFHAEGNYVSAGGQGFITKHTVPPLLSPGKVDLQQKIDVGAEEQDLNLVYLHATFMAVAWMFFASFGIFTARYYKKVWPEGSEVCGEKRWFIIHRTCMVLVFLFTAAGFTVIFVHIKGYSEIEGSRWNKSHPIIGIVVMSLAVLNPTIALFRPKPDAKYRPVFNFFHWVFGTGAHSLAIVNLFSGTYLSLTNVPSYIRIILYVFIGWYILMEFIFTFLECRRKKDRSEDYEMTTKGSPGNLQSTSQGSEVWRTMFLVLHAIVLLGFAAAVSVIVWLERDNE